jgi:hypothetical protein
MHERIHAVWVGLYKTHLPFGAAAIGIERNVLRRDLERLQASNAPAPQNTRERTRSKATA